MSTCSLEIFVPRSSAGVEAMAEECLDALASRGPSCISISGTNSRAVLSIAETLRTRHCIRPQLQLATALSTESSATALLDAALKVGVRDVLLLGGPPGALTSLWSALLSAPLTPRRHTLPLRHAQRAGAARLVWEHVRACHIPQADVRRA